VALAIDGSSPGVATATTGTTNKTITNCPANAVIVVVTSHNTTAGVTNASCAITDDKGLTWTQTAAHGEFDAGANAGLVTLNWARNGASIQTIVVTATGTNVRGEIEMDPYVLTAALASGSPIGAFTKHHDTDASALSVTLTTTGDGSLVFLAVSDWWASTNYTYGAGITNDASAINNGNNGYSYVHQTANVTTSGTSVTISSTSASATARNNAILFEVLAAVTAAAGAPIQPGRRPFWQWPRLPWLRRRTRPAPPLPISPPPPAAYNVQRTRLAIRRLFTPRRGRAPAPPLPTSPPPAAAYNLQRTRTTLRRLLPVRRARTVGPLPAVAVTPPPWLPVAVHSVRRLAVPARRAHASTPPLAPSDLPPAACRPIRRPLPAIRRAHSFAPPLPPPTAPPAAVRERVRLLPARRLRLAGSGWPPPERPPAPAARRLRVPPFRCRLRAQSPPFVVIVTPSVVTTPGSMVLTTAAGSAFGATAAGSAAGTTAAGGFTSTSSAGGFTASTTSGQQTSTTSGGGL
jgi:hypothetical protein